MSDEQCRQVDYVPIDYDHWVQIIEDMEKAGILYVVLTGGEPLLYPCFEQLYLLLSKKGFMVTLKTNGYFVEKYRSLFTQFPPYHVYISIYGWSNQTYAAVTGMRNGFDEVIRAINFFSELKVPMHTTFVALQNNYFDKVGYDEFRQNGPPGIKWCVLTDIYPHVVNPCFSKALSYRLTPAERVAWESTFPFDMEQYRAVVKQLNTLRESVSENDLFEPGSGERNIKHCLDAQNSCFIGCDGKMRFCAMSRYCHAEPLSNGVINAWNKLRQLEDDVYLEPAKCSRCRIKSYCALSCPARCAVENSKDVPPEYVCEYAIMKWLFLTIMQAGKNGG